jgi:hypothetical protein
MNLAHSEKIINLVCDYLMENGDKVSDNGLYIAIDPGAGRTNSIGWAIFLNDGRPAGMGQLTYEGLVDKLYNELNNIPVALVICEDYRIRREKISSHVGSRVETIQTIGTIRAWCQLKNIKLELQKSNILRLAEKQFGIAMPTDHTQSHQYSALLHGFWYLHRIGKAKTVLEREHDAS